MWCRWCLCDVWGLNPLPPGVSSHYIDTTALDASENTRGSRLLSEVTRWIDRRGAAVWRGRLLSVSGRPSLQPTFITSIHHRRPPLPLPPPPPPPPPQPWTPRGLGRGLALAFIISAWTATLGATAVGTRWVTGAWWTPAEEGWATRSRATPAGRRTTVVGATRITSSSTPRGATCPQGRSATLRTELTDTPGPVSRLQ